MVSDNPPETEPEEGQGEPAGDTPPEAPEGEEPKPEGETSE